MAYKITARKKLIKKQLGLTEKEYKIYKIGFNDGTFHSRKK